MMRSLLVPLALVIVAGACSAGGGGPVDGGIHDAIYEVSLTLPDGCPPATANEKGVGTPCTMGGKQCQNPLKCTCDPFFGIQLTGVPCMCTLAQIAPTGSTDPCGPPLAANFCGSNAVCCPYLTAAAYCVPSICLPGGNMCPEVAPPSP